MKILFFAQSRVATGCDQWELKAGGPLTQAELWSELIEAHPDLAPIQKTARLARNETYLQEGEPLLPGDEVAIIPPVSGG